MVAPNVARMALTVDLDTGRTALLASMEDLQAAIDGMTERDLLGQSACHGWSRLDVVTHLVFGGYELLAGLASRGAGPPTVDAASFWRAFDDFSSKEDPIQVLMEQRRRTGVYARPEAARTHLRDVFWAVGNGVRDLDERPVVWLGQVFTAGDFAAVWAVENAVHHLDLLVPDPPAPEALRLARRTVDALLPAPTPTGWSDTDAVLVGAGRLSARGDGPLAQELPVLG